MCFIHSILVFGHFWQRSYKNTKTLHNHCLHFARQNGQDGKNWKENHATKVTKNQKTKLRDERKSTHKINRLDTIQLVEYFIETNLLSNL